MLTDLVKKIASESGLPEHEIMRRIDEKQTELSGMVSEEGAAYMVAKEFGVSLLKKSERALIKDVLPGMKNVEIMGKILKINEHQFKTQKAAGVVSNVFLKDETGTLRMSLWNDEIDKMDAREGDVIRVRGYTKEDNLGNPELRIGRFGSLQKTDHFIDERKETKRTFIENMKEGSLKEIRAAVVQIFESNIFYEICPECHARVKRENNFACDDHGVVEPEYGIVLSGVIDDGTGNIRAVMFGESAEMLIGMNVKDAKKRFDETKSISRVLENVELGTEYVFEGSARRNKLFDRLEFVVNSVKIVDVKKEIEMMMND